MVKLFLFSIFRYFSLIFQYFLQFLVCFQARGAPGEGQGDPGARRRPEDPENVVKPIGNLWKTSAKAI